MRLSYISSQTLPNPDYIIFSVAHLHPKADCRKYICEKVENIAMFHMIELIHIPIEFGRFFENHDIYGIPVYLDGLLENKIKVRVNERGFGN